jgi:hypothetical protein
MPAPDVVPGEPRQKLPSRDLRPAVGSVKRSGGRRGSTWPRRRIDSYVGVDIGSGEVRVAVMRATDPRGNLVHWAGYHRFPIDIQPPDRIRPEQLHAVIDAIGDRMPRCIEGERNLAAVALPLRWTRYQTIEGQQVAATEAENDQRFQSSAFQSPAQVCHWPVVGIHHGVPCPEDQYVTCAVPRRIARDIADRISGLGYAVETMLPHGVALAQAAEPLTGVRPQSVIWLGHHASLIAVLHRSGVGLVRMLPPPMQSIPDWETNWRHLDAFSVRPHLSRIATEVESTLRYAARADMSPIGNQPLLLAGTLAELPGVVEFLANRLQLPIAPWAYLGRNRPTPPASLQDAAPETIRRHDARYATALSLAWAAATGRQT